MEENIYNSSLQIMLSKSDAQPWGFRITGGADFGTPLTIIKVYGGSIAEQAGLQVDDILVGINEYPLTNLSHQEAYEAFVNAGKSFLLSIIRGSQISSSPSNMAMEMAFMENEYINAYSQNTSENMTTTEVLEQEIVKEQTDNSTLASQPGLGLDAIVAAVLSQGTASQYATESETFNDIYVLSQETASQDVTEFETFNNVFIHQDTERQFEDLSYVLTEKTSNRDECAASIYQMEGVKVVDTKDYKDGSYTMDKNLAGDQLLEPEATETKFDYQYSEQRLEAEATETKSNYQYSQQQSEAEATETKSNYQCSQQQSEAEATETKSDYQCSQQQSEAEATETKSDYQCSQQQLEAEATETKSDYQFSEQQLEAEAIETKSDYQLSEQQLEAEAIETKSDYQYSEQQLEAEATETKSDHPFSEQVQTETIKGTAEEKPPVENAMPDTGVEQQDSDMQLKDNIERNHPFLPVVAHPRPVIGAGGIKHTLPKDLFDDEFIAETLSGNAEIITGTTLGVNFHKYRRNYDYLKSSSVYQLIHEEESKSSSSFQE